MRENWRGLCIRALVNAIWTEKIYCLATLFADSRSLHKLNDTVAYLRKDMQHVPTHPQHCGIFSDLWQLKLTQYSAILTDRSTLSLQIGTQYPKHRQSKGNHKLNEI